MAAPALPPLPLHMLFFPFVVPGHLLSMLDLARTFSRRGAKASVVTIPSTTAAVRSHVRGSPDGSDDDPIELIELHLPEAPPSADDTHMGVLCMIRDLHTLRRPFQKLLRSRRTDCVVSDMFLPWTAEAARELGIPRLVFHGVSVFSLCCIHTIRHGKPLPDRDLGDGEAFVIPDFPNRVELAWSELPDFIQARTAFTEEMERITDLDAASDGVVANSFYGMDGRYAEHFEKLTGKKAWLVGPIHLHSGREHSRVDTGGCLSWLDAQPLHSVVYVCFGSLCEFQQTQLREISSGLAASRCRFLWVVKSNVGESEEDSWPWMSEGLRGRIVEGAGLVVQSWAPQVAILGHGAVGAFVTHCGWNSVMEAAAAGVPMLTWPLTAEQFYNEKLVTGVLGLGVAVGRARVWTPGVEGRPLVRAEEIWKAVERVVMGGGGDEAVKLRKRAKETAAMAHEAVGEGGSSSDDVIHLVHAIHKSKKRIGEKHATPGPKPAVSIRRLETTG
ncbi:hypothetical protein Taro_039204 [Colocasia esculenta]|uniref:Glycosyltransferase n=1 Tax=Colocasia esculenta TaxID=4460 RepID=A0A843W8P8_COLES|nr:hypothetical protein [Colocasia esculenta]